MNNNNSVYNSSDNNCVSKSIDSLNKLEKIEEIEQRTYNGVYYADAMDMEAAMKEHAKQQKRNNALHLWTFKTPTLF
jgi:t-SNARE complex subunit (syntaxin)